MLVINMFAAAGAGKTTLAAMVFGALKMSGSGLASEWAPEIAKEFVWEKRNKALHNRIHMLGAQDFAISRLDGEVDIVVTDGPVLLNLAYARMEGGWPESYADLCVWAHRRFRTLNIFVERQPGVPFDPRGRREGADAVEAFDLKIRSILSEFEIPVTTAVSSQEDADRIAKLAISLAGHGRNQ